MLVEKIKQLKEQRRAVVLANAAMTKDEAQRSIRTFYEAVNAYPGLFTRLLTERPSPTIFCHHFV